MLHNLRPVFEEMAEHERSVAQARELLQRAVHVDDARRSLLERAGRTSRPLNRRFNKAWKRWREAVVAEIDATDAALIARVDENSVASRVRAAFAANDHLDYLPGWLLLRLHDNAVVAGAIVHPITTEDYAGIMREMCRLEQSLKEKDSRRLVLRGEMDRHNDIHETRRKVASLIGDLQSHNDEAALLGDAARRKSLPVQQSMAWARWYKHSRSLEERARGMLSGGEYRADLHDGQGMRQAFKVALARFEETRTAHGELDESARIERRRKAFEELARAQSRRRDDGRTAGGGARFREEIAQDAALGARDRQETDDAGDAMTKLKDLKTRFMEHPEFREEYGRADEEYVLVEALVRTRTAAKLTRAELARRLGTTQSAVARLEGGRVSPSIATLRRSAEATGTRLTVDLVPAG